MAVRRLRQIKHRVEDMCMFVIGISALKGSREIVEAMLYLKEPPAARALATSRLINDGR